MTDPRQLWFLIDLFAELIRKYLKSITYKCYSDYCFILSKFQICQGIASILYHFCPNPKTHGVDVIPMQAMILLFMRKPAISFFQEKYGCIVDFVILVLQLVSMLGTVYIVTFIDHGVIISVCGLTVIYVFIAILAAFHNAKKIKEHIIENCTKWSTFPWCLMLNLVTFCISFGVSIKFFTQKSIDNSTDQATSREFNQDCIIGFFDQHDIWHFSSAVLLLTQLIFLKYFPKKNIITSTQDRWPSADDLKEKWQLRRA